MSVIPDEISHTIDVSALRQPAAQVEAYLTDFLDQRPLPDNLADALRYALLGGGKRLRPILTLRSCEAVGGRAEDAVAAAAAIEMIHCFSLIHDDLPAMDDDDLRRGVPTLHKATSEAMAILAGDALVGLAFEVVGARVEPPALAAKIVSELSTATNDMIAGQVYDTLPEFPPEWDEVRSLRTIHRNKTAALIRCSCRMGAMCGNADQERLDALSAYGEAIGLMFQIVDDLLDVTQTTEHLGKAARKDAGQGKVTYPGILGIDASRAEVDRLRSAALEALDRIGQSGGRSAEKGGVRALRDLCHYMAVRTS